MHQFFAKELEIYGEFSFSRVFINDFQSYISLKVWKYFDKNKNTLPRFKISKIYEENFVPLPFFFPRFCKEFLILTLGWIYRNILTKIKIYFIFWNTKNFIDKFIHRKKFPILYCSKTFPFKMLICRAFLQFLGLTNFQYFNISIYI